MLIEKGMYHMKIISIIIISSVLLFSDTNNLSLSDEGCLFLKKKDYKNAKIKFEEASLNKECRGMFNLALLHMNAHGVEQNYKKAMKYFKESLNNNCLNSAYDVGVMYRNGEGVPKNLDKAKEYYLIASDNNHSLAQFELGKIYGSEQNIKKFIFWTDKALKNGYKPRTDNDKKIMEYLDSVRTFNEKSKKL